MYNQFISQPILANCAVHKISDGHDAWQVTTKIATMHWMQQKSHEFWVCIFTNEGGGVAGMGVGVAGMGGGVGGWVGGDFLRWAGIKYSCMADIFWCVQWNFDYIIDKTLIAPTKRYQPQPWLKKYNYISIIREGRDSHHVLKTWWRSDTLKWILNGELFIYQIISNLLGLNHSRNSLKRDTTMFVEYGNENSCLS